MMLYSFHIDESSIGSLENINLNPDDYDNISLAQEYQSYHSLYVQRCAVYSILKFHYKKAGISLRPRLTHDTFGRPLLDGEPNISISHKPDVVFVCLGRYGGFGVDVENLDQDTNVSNLENVLCTGVNSDIIDYLKGEYPDKFLLIIWSIKESFLKSLGRIMPFEKIKLDFSGERKIISSSDGSYKISSFLIKNNLVYSISADNGVILDEKSIEDLSHTIKP